MDQASPASPIDVKCASSSEFSPSTDVARSGIPWSFEIKLRPGMPVKLLSGSMSLMIKQLRNKVKVFLKLEPQFNTSFIIGHVRLYQSQVRASAQTLPQGVPDGNLRRIKKHEKKAFILKFKIERMGVKDLGRRCQEVYRQVPLSDLLSQGHHDESLPKFKAYCEAPQQSQGVNGMRSGGSGGADALIQPKCVLLRSFKWFL